MSFFAFFFAKEIDDFENARIYKSHHDLQGEEVIGPTAPPGFVPDDTYMCQLKIW